MKVLVIVTGLLLFSTVVCGLWIRYSGEVVDDILVRGYELFRSQPEGEFSHATMYRLADEIIRDEITNYRDKEESGISLEEELPHDDPPGAVPGPS